MLMKRAYPVNKNSNDEKTITRYLLGELPEQEQLRLEEEYFSNAGVFEQFLVVEDQLIDDYLRGQLPRRKRNRFKKYFLSSARRRERVDLAEAMNKRLSRPAAAVAASPITSPEPLASRRSFPVSPRALSLALRLSIALATLLVITGAAWLAFENARLRGQAERLRAEQSAQQQREQALREQIAESNARVDQLAKQMQRTQVDDLTLRKPSQREPSILTLVLTAGLQRDGGGMSRLVIPRHARSLRIKINFEPDHQYIHYNVVLRKAEGNQVLTLNRLRARSTALGEIIVLNLPTGILDAREYVLSLSGVTASGGAESIEDYTFSISKDSSPR